MNSMISDIVKFDYSTIGTFWILTAISDFKFHTIVKWTSQPWMPMLL